MRPTERTKNYAEGRNNNIETGTGSQITCSNNRLFIFFFLSPFLFFAQLNRQYPGVIRSRSRPLRSIDNRFLFNRKATKYRFDPPFDYPIAREKHYIVENRRRSSYKQCRFNDRTWTLPRVQQLTWRWTRIIDLKTVHFHFRKLERKREKRREAS